MPQVIADYRVLATDLRAISERSTDAPTKEELRLLADQFERLAEFRERTLKLPRALEV